MRNIPYFYPQVCHIFSKTKTLEVWMGLKLWFIDTLWVFWHSLRIFLRYTQFNNLDTIWAWGEKPPYTYFLPITGEAVSWLSSLRIAFACRLPFNSPLPFMRVYLRQSNLSFHSKPLLKCCMPLQFPFDFHNQSYYYNLLMRIWQKLVHKLYQLCWGLSAKN